MQISFIEIPSNFDCFESKLVSNSFAAIFFANVFGAKYIVTPEKSLTLNSLFACSLGGLLKLIIEILSFSLGTYTKSFGERLNNK